MALRFTLLFPSAILWLLITNGFAQPPTDSRGGKTQATPTASGKNTAYGVVVGISTYQFLPALRFADRDALVFADYLVRSAGVPTSQIETLINQQATLINLTDALTTVKKKVKPGDRVYVYFAGHGDIETRNNGTENAMLMLHRASRKDYNAAFDKCYLRDMKRWLDELTQAGAEVVFVADACRSGAFVLMGGQAGQSQTMVGLSREWGQVKILSCEPGELAIEGKEFGNGRGVFSYCLVDGLMGMADTNKDNVITKRELAVYLMNTVPETAKPHIQNPQVMGGDADLPLGTFNADSLRLYKQRKTRDYSLLTATQTKGFEADLLRGQDPATRRQFRLFEQAIKNRKLLHPAGQSALHYLRQIPARNNTKLLGLMKRNLVAALQVRTEGLLRPLLQEVKDDFKSSIPTAQLDSAIAEMDTSIALLGKGHNLTQNLTARRLFLEGKRLLTSKREHYELNDTLSQIAMTRFRESIRLEPNMPYTYWEMNMAHDMLFQVDSSMIYREKCLELLPNSSLVWSSLGSSYSIRGQLQKAKTYYERAHQIDPDDLAIQGSLAEIFHGLGDETQVAIYQKKALAEYEQQTSGKADRKRMLGLADLLKSTGEYDKAINLVQALLRTDSTDADVLLKFCIILLDQKKFSEVIPVIDKLVHLYPSFGVAHAFRGAVYAGRYQQSKQPADLNQATESAEESLRLNPGNFLGLTIRCAYEFNRDNYKAALPFAQRAVRINPSIGFLHYMLGVTSRMLRDTTQARLSLTQADSLGYDKSEIYKQFGALYEGRKNYAAAENYYRKADALDPNDPTTLAWFIECLWLQQKKTDELLSLCLRLQKLEPTNVDAWTIAGYLYSGQRKYKEALSAYTEASRLNPKSDVIRKSIKRISRRVK
jgi:protein O-mannosyl-transferase